MDELDAYEHGSQNAATQVADYRIFMNFTKWFALHLGALLLLLTLWFCVGTGFWGAFIPSAIVLAIGIFLLRAKPAPVH
jgi:hypothetical protein